VGSSFNGNVRLQKIQALQRPSRIQTFLCLTRVWSQGSNQSFSLPSSIRFVNTFAGSCILCVHRPLNMPTVPEGCLRTVKKAAVLVWWGCPGRAPQPVKIRPFFMIRLAHQTSCAKSQDEWNRKVRTRNNTLGNLNC
jgi:hypothetical protein